MQDKLLSSTSITGLNNNEYQISRGEADFMKLPFSDSTFDAIYAIEATCHAPDVVGCYKEIYRVLKPGQCFSAYEWCMTKHYDPKNQEHQKLKAEIELGNGLPDVRSTDQCLEALEMTMLAKQCVDKDPILQPDMKQVVISLSHILLSFVEWEAVLAGNSPVFSGLVQERWPFSKISHISAFILLSFPIPLLILILEFSTLNG